MIYLSPAAFLFVSELLLKLLMIVILLLSKKKSDSAKIAWMLLIIALPFIGTIIFLLIGTRRLGSRRRKRHKEIQRTIPQNVSCYISDPNLYSTDVDSKYCSVAHIAETIGGSHVLSGNNAMLFGDSEKMIRSVASDIDEAKKHCHILSYIMLVDKAGQKISDALIAATKRGVECRLLLDSMGSKDFLKSDLCKRVKDAGVHVVEALPANVLRALFARVDLRNHRKIAVIDNAIGYMGSNNIAEPVFAPKPKFAPWVDASVRLTGPIVRELQAIFIQDWFMDSDENLSSLLQEPLEVDNSGITTQLMATGPNSNNLALSQLLQTAFFSAKTELVITTPYFSPDDSTESALLISAKRGVETHLVLPARNDSKLVQAASRSRYGALLNAGVQIHEFNGGLLHAKTMTIDREIALIGSANMDRRSLDLNFEISMLVFNSDFASELRFLQTTYIEQSTSVPITEPQKWSIGTRLWQNSISLIAPIL
jgi:cardiolipin synthase